MTCEIFHSLARANARDADKSFELKGLERRDVIPGPAALGSAQHYPFSLLLSNGLPGPVRGHHHFLFKKKILINPLIYKEFCLIDPVFCLRRRNTG